jgi:hypothetical protein
MRQSDDEYVRYQSGALVDAVQAEGAGGVGKRSFQLAEHLAAEGGFHRGDIIAATALLLAIMAWCDGEADAADRFARRMREQNPDSVELIEHVLRLETGWDQGWLPRAEYDGLIAYARRTGRKDMEARARVLGPRDVERGPARRSDRYLTTYAERRIFPWL